MAVCERVEWELTVVIARHATVNGCRLHVSGDPAPEPWLGELSWRWRVVCAGPRLVGQGSAATEREAMAAARKAAEGAA